MTVQSSFSIYSLTVSDYTALINEAIEADEIDLLRLRKRLSIVEEYYATGEEPADAPLYFTEIDDIPTEQDLQRDISRHEESIYGFNVVLEMVKLHRPALIEVSHEALQSVMVSALRHRATPVPTT